MGALRSHRLLARGFGGRQRGLGDRCGWGGHGNYVPKILPHIGPQSASRRNLVLYLLAKRDAATIEPALDDLPINANCAGHCRLGLVVPQEV